MIGGLYINLWCVIAKHLRPKDIFTLMRTCSKLHHLYNTDTLSWNAHLPDELKDQGLKGYKEYVMYERCRCCLSKTPVMVEIGDSRKKFCNRVCHYEYYLNKCVSVSSVNSPQKSMK